MVKYFALKEFVKKSNLITRIVSLKSNLWNNTSNTNTDFQSVYDISEYNLPIPVEKEVVTDLYEKKYGLIREMVCDFQYLNYEKKKDLKIYKLQNDNQSFLVIGARKRIILSKLC